MRINGKLRYVNIYVVTLFIGFFSLVYIISYAFVLSDVNNGSSRAMKQKYCDENPKLCYVAPKSSEQSVQ